MLLRVVSFWASFSSDSGNPQDDFGVKLVSSWPSSWVPVWPSCVHENDDRVWFDLLQVGFKILAGGGFSKPIPGDVKVVVYVEFGDGSGVK